MKPSKTVISELHACLHECVGIVLDHVAIMPPELWTKELAGFGKPTVRDQIVHVFSAEAGWVCGLQLLPYQRPDPASINTIGALRKLQQDVMTATTAYLGSLDERTLDAELDQYPERWIGPRRSPAFILLHVITHGFHHKGQIVAMLRLLGHPAPDTDMQRESIFPTPPFRATQVESS
jgi:uncharacterized damage-inducible protein DinB